MKTAVISATALALAAAGVVAGPASARDYGYYGAACQAKKSDAGTTGAVLGGIAGALLGSGIAGHGDKTGGAVIGAAAGALLGHSLGRAEAKDSRACDGRDYGRISYQTRARYYAPRASLPHTGRTATRATIPTATEGRDAVPRSPWGRRPPIAGGRRNAAWAA
jgi:hypothetical protein